MSRLDGADELLDLALPRCTSCLHLLIPHPKLDAWLCEHCGLGRVAKCCCGAGGRSLRCVAR
ncbi:hypothetical protein, partial [Microbacterium sp. MRS-1]|uniref:hypothetical protein n=1 Tax=Microbacterium sp. MRS-1 TaxID=1451261 RepID=UPI001E334F7A